MMSMKEGHMEVKGQEQHLEGAEEREATTGAEAITDLTDLMLSISMMIGMTEVNQCFDKT
jgi:hypothetical protein